jgi:ketosteroid isomerase-like protein
MTTNTERTTADVLAHHVQAVTAGDLEALMSDYADDAVLLTVRGGLKGTEALRDHFALIFDSVPDDIRQSLKIERQFIEGEFAFVIYSMGKVVPFAADTFCIREGRIAMQSGVTQTGG